MPKEQEEGTLRFTTDTLSHHLNLSNRQTRALLSDYQRLHRLPPGKRGTGMTLNAKQLSELEQYARFIRLTGLPLSHLDRLKQLDDPQFWAYLERPLRLPANASMDIETTQQLVNLRHTMTNVHALVESMMRPLARLTGTAAGLPVAPAPVIKD